MKILVATSLKETYGKEEEILFAGDWVKSSLNFEKDFENREYSFFGSIWEDEKNLREFHPYLVKLRNRLIKKLSSDLNVIHNTDYPLKFWRIIINPWLHYYLEGVYTRWETINKILNKKENLNFIYLNDIKYLDSPFDVRDFYHYITTSDIYNQYIFQKVIKYFVDVKKSRYLKLIYSDKKIDRRENLGIETGFEEDNKNYVKRFISYCLKFLSKKNKFFIELNSLGLNFILLNFKLKQVPFKDYEFFTFRNYCKLSKNKSAFNSELRKNFFFEFDKKNDFEDFLSRNFSKDIPKCLIEDFFTIQNFVKDIPYKSKVIVSDVKHEHDIIFKFWSANKVRNGSKFIISDHGGSYGSAVHDLFLHEEMSDITIRWHKPIMNNNVQLPVLYLLNKKRKNKTKNKRKYLLTIGFSGTKYPRYIFINPNSGRLLYQIDHLSSFYENLDLELKDKFLFRPARYDDWNFAKRFEHIFQKKRIISSTKQYWHYFNKSKIIVCTYPKTAFCEAMVSGPTILLFKSKYFRNYSEEFNQLHENLQKAKILFEDPILASKHINEIWENVDDWWEDQEVKIARENFNKEAALLESHPFEKWKKFLYNLEI